MTNSTDTSSMKRKCQVPQCPYRHDDMPTYEQLIEEALREFDREFTNTYPGDSGIGGNQPQEPVYELCESDPKEYKRWFEKKMKLIASKAGDEEREKFFIDKNITVEVEDGRLFIGVGKISSTWSLHSDEEEKDEFYTGVYVDNENSRGWTIVQTPMHKEAHKALFEKQKNKIKSTPKEQQ